MKIFEKTAWNFNKDVDSKEEFKKEIDRYQTAIMQGKSTWDPDAVVLESPKVDIQYMVWVKGEEDMQDNEKLLEEDEDFFDADNAEDGMFQAEIIGRFKADNGKNFTALELLYKVHRQMQTKDLGDHTFFEGFSENDYEDGTPAFFLDCGS
jgi:hypothetical protein